MEGMITIVFRVISSPKSWVLNHMKESKESKGVRLREECKNIVGFPLGNLKARLLHLLLFVIFYHIFSYISVIEFCLYFLVFLLG